MEEIIGTTIDNMQIGDIITHKNMAITPLTIAPQSGPTYLTMSQGFERHFLSVQEISEGGSVPELSVMNNGDQFILLMDGEEISGAKQNRVLNPGRPKNEDHHSSQLHRTRPLELHLKGIQRFRNLDGKVYTIKQTGIRDSQRTRKKKLSIGSG